MGEGVSPAGGDPSAGGEVSPEQLLPERGVLLFHPDLRAPLPGECHRPSTSNWVTGLPLWALPPPFFPRLWPEKLDITVGLDHRDDRVSPFSAGGENEVQGEEFC